MARPIRGATNNQLTPERRASEAVFWAWYRAMAATEAWKEANRKVSRAAKDAENAEVYASETEHDAGEAIDWAMDLSGHASTASAVAQASTAAVPSSHIVEFGHGAEKATHEASDAATAAWNADPARAKDEASAALTATKRAASKWKDLAEKLNG